MAWRGAASARQAIFSGTSARGLRVATAWAHGPVVVVVVVVVVVSGAAARFVRLGRKEDWI